MKSISKVIVILLILGTIPITMVEGSNDTASINTTSTGVTSVNKTSVVVTSIPSVITSVPTPGKFRVGPTVRIRPLNDEITKDQDGLVELYMDNPSLNEVSLSVDARISVPSGIHVYGQSFGEAGAAGMVYGKFEIPPGSARTINIVIKADKIGDFNAQFSGLYWPGDDKDAYQPISLTHPFKVTSPSRDPLKDTSGDEGGDKGKSGKTEKSPGISIIAVISVITIMAYMLRRKN